MKKDTIYCKNHYCPHNVPKGMCELESIDLFVDESGFVKCHCIK